MWPDRPSVFILGAVMLEITLLVGLGVGLSLAFSPQGAKRDDVMALVLCCTAAAGLAPVVAMAAWISDRLARPLQRIASRLIALVLWSSLVSAFLIAVLVGVLAHGIGILSDMPDLAATGAFAVLVFWLLWAALFLAGRRRAGA